MKVRTFPCCTSTDKMNVDAHHSHHVPDCHSVSDISLASCSSTSERALPLSSVSIAAFSLKEPNQSNVS